MNQPKFIISYQMEEPIRIQMVKPLFHHFLSKVLNVRYMFEIKMFQSGAYNLWNFILFHMQFQLLFAQNEEKIVISSPFCPSQQGFPWPPSYIENDTHISQMTLLM